MYNSYYEYSFNNRKSRERKVEKIKSKHERIKEHEEAYTAYDILTSGTIEFIRVIPAIISSITNPLG